MATKLSPGAQKVQQLLQDQGFSSQVLELADSTRTAQEAAQAVGCTVEQIVKSLIFKGRDSQKPILIVASGGNRVSERKIKDYVGEKIEKADADFVRQVTGFVIGGVAPLGHTTPLETYIDEDLLQFSEIWAAAGTPHAVFKLTPQELVTITGGKVVSIK